MNTNTYYFTLIRAVSCFNNQRMYSSPNTKSKLKLDLQLKQMKAKIVYMGQTYPRVHKHLLRKN